MSANQQPLAPDSSPELSSASNLVSDLWDFGLHLDRQETLLVSSIAAVAVTALFILLVRLVWRINGRTKLFIESSRHLEQSRFNFLLRSKVIDRAAINQVAGFIVDSASIVSTLFLTYIYIPVVLSFFSWTQGWADKIFSMIVEPVKWLWSGITSVVPNLFFIVAIIVFARYLLKAIRFFFVAIETGRLQFTGFHQDWARPTYQIARIFVILLAVVMCFPYVPGSNSPAFQGISVFLGVLVSLGSTSAISNTIAGVVMTYMRPFKIGDRVKIVDTVGDVVEKSLLVTRIRTIKNVDVTIPNSLILGTHIINYSAMAEDLGLILNTTVTIGYDTPWPQVHKALIDAAGSCTDVLKEPKPFVFQTALNDYYVHYELNAYTRNANSMQQTYSELHTAIQISFQKAGIEIMSPAYTSLRDGSKNTIPEISISRDLV
ncbi:MAG: mechanosensitive ion channel family protein [Bdellovibrionales bacterium]|nr:mechanosensitive ion channel family protein [Bdellovibrionales bacterium]